MQERNQAHLGYKDTVNRGSYYTPPALVSRVYQMLRRHVPDFTEYAIVDTSCGYGSFLLLPNCIGADNDQAALKYARHDNPDCHLFCHNSLEQVSRAQYGLNKHDRLIIIGNPPYNDRTSIIRNTIKQQSCVIDADLSHRDMGFSFLLSYEKLQADYICVLHPLSYLIKKANFISLGVFRKHYRLIDNFIISSGEFSATSKATQFPIIIALYKRDPHGMDYADICQMRFSTPEGKSFILNQYDKLSRYITKYPNHKCVSLADTIAYFWTMRDINALKRTRSFVQQESYNSIRVTQKVLPFYCYADIFKQYIPYIPYYFGNSDIIIDHIEFARLESVFVRESLSKHSFLRHLAPPAVPDAKRHLDIYFRNLLGEHYAA